MGLKVPARWAGNRLHVLPAVTPGATATRLAVEAEIVRSGTVDAAGPADADVLLVVGSPGSELAAAIDEVWRQMPGPRVRVHVGQPESATGALRRAREVLSAGRGEPGPEEEPSETSGGSAVEHTGRRDDEESQEEGNGGDMSMPAGLPMARRGTDRDGLKLDVLRVPLGPVLPDWPAGLVVDLLLQGDVVQQVHSRVLPAAAGTGTPFWRGAGAHGPRRTAASDLDSLGRFLAVAGWSAMAYRVRRVRDAVLTGVPADRIRRELAGVDRRLRRSVTLRWATGGLGVLTAGAAERLGVTGPAGEAVTHGGDVTARWRCWLAEADRLLADDASGRPGTQREAAGDRPAAAALIVAAEELMVGLDVAAARLVLASFDPDPDELVAAQPAEARS